MRLGDQYGRWRIVRESSGDKVRAQFLCGTIKRVKAAHLRSGRSQSCGCLRAELLSDRRTRHGATDTRAYRAWCRMKQRCGNPSTRGYNVWGGRGIAVCDRWRSSFESFLRDMGPCPPGGSLDRIDNERGYEPSNCRWASQRQQCNNQRRNVRITYDGRTETLADWAREMDLPYATLHRRIVIRSEQPPHAFRKVDSL